MLTTTRSCDRCGRYANIINPNTKYKITFENGKEVDLCSKCYQELKVFMEIKKTGACSSYIPTPVNPHWKDR